MIQEFEDVVPLLEIDRVQNISHDGRREGSWIDGDGLIAIHTSSLGYNVGRKYCMHVTELGLKGLNFDGASRDSSSAPSFSSRHALRSAPAAEECAPKKAREMVFLLEELIYKAQQDKLDADVSLVNLFLRAREWMRNAFTSNLVQVI